MTLRNAVANPIINNAFAEPTQYYDFSGDAPVIRPRRREAVYLRSNRAQVRSVAQQVTIPPDRVNTIRSRVRAWRDEGYPGVTRVTADLLRHWNDPYRQRQLFFCQREAVETII